ncbi:MAG: hypothetical protein EOP76_18965 [Variovorax sp.]|nr:MAG: hypothetical protein EOP76_18965 [Variovorax sp.]
MLLQIVSHTPRWVFAVFALLLWLGGRQMVAGRLSLTRVAVIPVAMAGLSVYGVFSAFGDSPMALAGWAAAAVVAVVLVLQRALPASTRFDADTRTFHVAGSAVPLLLMMGIFFTKYVVGVQIAMHPELAHHHNFALAIGTLYGAFSGIFAGRALRLWKLAARRDSALAGGQVA